MKKVFLTSTALVAVSGMAVADVTVSGSAEMGVKGSKGSDVALHRDIQVAFALAGATDTGLSFGASAKVHEAEASRFEKQSVHLTGAFGTLTLGDTDGAFDAALTEVGAGGAINDDHTGHPGYNGNGGLAGSINNPNTLRYDYTLGGITTSVSGEFGADDTNNSVLGIGMAWSGDMGGIGIGIGLGYETGSNTTAPVAGSEHSDTAHAVAAVDGKMEDSSIVGMSISVDMGNGLSVVANASSKKVETDMAMGADTTATTNHTGVGVAYTVGALTIGINGGQNNTKGTTPMDASGAGFSAVYNLGTGVDFKIGAGAGKEGATTKSSWSAGLAFSF